MDARNYRPASTDRELLPVVNEQDQVIAHATRAEVHSQSLLHRAVHIVVRRSGGAIILQRRSHLKDLLPGWWDISVGGHVNAHEEYAAAAERELREELGIVGAPFIESARIAACPMTGWEFVRIYECVWDGPLAPDPDEVTATREVTLSLVQTNAPPDPAEPQSLITAAGRNSILAWARATGRIPPSDLPPSES